jgi:hypothetical protein
MCWESRSWPLRQREWGPLGRLSLVVARVHLDGRSRQAPLLFVNRSPVCFELLAGCASVSKLLALEHELAKAFHDRFCRVHPGSP